MKPLAIDLYCGLGGWTEGLLAEGYNVVGFDNELHAYGEHRYPAQLVIQDVRTLHGSQFKDAALIVASPPCTEFSYMAMPWSRAKQIARALRGDDEFPPGYTGSRTLAELTELFDACFRIQREACEAAGRHIPLVVENVVGAQAWVGPARWHFGSFYLWGDVPALMPLVRRVAKAAGQDWNNYAKTGEASPHWRLEGAKNTGGSWFNVAHNTTSGKGQNPDGRKLVDHDNKRDGFPHTKHLTSPNEHGRKHEGSGAVWFDTGPAALSSKSSKRKAASALIAKIPLALSRHIAACWRPAP